MVSFLLSMTLIVRGILFQKEDDAYLAKSSYYKSLSFLKAV